MRIKLGDIESLLFGKAGTEALDIDQYESVNFRSSKVGLKTPSNAAKLWKKVTNFATGNKRDGKINKYILRDQAKKEVSSMIEKLGPERDIILKNFNVFKALVFQL